MRTIAASTALLLALSSLVGCAAPADGSDDDATTAESSVKGSFVGRTYTFQGELSVGTRCIRSALGNPENYVNGKFVCPHPTPTKVLGLAQATIKVVRKTDVVVPGFIGTSESFAADVHVDYPAADGSGMRTAEAKDLPFDLEPNGYGPFKSVATVGDVTLEVTISDFGKNEMFYTSMSMEDPAPRKFVQFRTTSVSGPM